MSKPTQSTPLTFGPTGFIARRLAMPPDYNGLLCDGLGGSLAQREAAWADYDARQQKLHGGVGPIVLPDGPYISEKS